MSEAYVIRINAEWEQNRFLATMMHNLNCTKKSQMIKPHELFPLPQDNTPKQVAPKSSKKEYEQFQELVNSKLNKK